MIPKISLCAAIAAMLLATSAFADDADKFPFSHTYGPFTLAGGPSSGGGFGATINGSRDYLSAPFGISDAAGVTTSQEYGVTYDVSGSFSTKPDTPSNATLTLSPTYGLGVFGYEDPECKPATGGTPPSSPGAGDPTVPVRPTCVGHTPELMGAFLSADLRYRYGTFKSGSALVRANQFIVGPSLTLNASYIRSHKAWEEWFDLSPKLTVGFYKVVGTSGDTLALPDSIKANFLQTEVQASVAPPIAKLLGHAFDGVAKPLTIDVKYDGSRAMTGADRAWQSLWFIQTSFAWMPDQSLKPGITYQSGKNGSFEYDRQVLLGFVMTFADKHDTSTSTTLKQQQDQADKDAAAKGKQQ